MIFQSTADAAILSTLLRKREKIGKMVIGQGLLTYGIREMAQNIISTLLLP